MTWSYDADVTHFFKPASSNTTFQHAQNLLNEIERDRRDPSEVSLPESLEMPHGDDTRRKDPSLSSVIVWAVSLSKM